MSPLNNLFNQAAEQALSPSFFQRHVSARLNMVGKGIPLELMAALQNALQLPVQSTLLIFKLPPKIINLFVGSLTLKEFETCLPGPLELVKTALKVVGYILGAFLTVTLGFVSPYVNFRVHVALGLITDRQAEEAIFYQEQEAARLKAYKQEAMDVHLHNYVEALKIKNIAHFSGENNV